MDFSLTEEQELLLASIRELITTNFPEEYFRTCDQNGTYPREFMRALADNGISMLGVPEEFGGIPADYVTQMLALMEVSKCGAPAFLITNGQCITVCAVSVLQSSYVKRQRAPWKRVIPPMPWH